MSALWSSVYPSLFQQTLRAAIPVVLAALGCLLTDQVGMMNIGVEGMMLIGAFFAVWGSWLFGSWAAGLAFALGVGIVLGLFYYVMVIRFRADEFIIGVALNLFAIGLTTFLLRTVFGKGIQGSLAIDKSLGLPTLDWPWLAGVPILGPLLNGNTLLVYACLLLVLLCWVMLYKTPLGYHLRAAGEHPEALRTAGKSPERMKLLASVLCGALSALAGAHLSTGYLTMFSENMSANRGFVAVACVIFGASNPSKVFLAALLFGFLDALGLRLQEYVSSYITAMVPYVVTVLMMVLAALLARRRRNRARERLVPDIKE